MNRETAKELLPITVYFANDGHIQRLLSDGTWVDADEFLPDSGAKYRKKPMLLECWVFEYDNKSLTPETFNTEQDAKSYMKTGVRRYGRLVHMREVEE